jgi:hypothetical protein
MQRTFAPRRQHLGGSMSMENDVETLRHIRARRVAYRESITLPKRERSCALDALAVAASAATMAACLIAGWALLK